jgi:hypothetical protein
MRSGARGQRPLQMVMGVLALGVLAHGLHAVTGVGSDALFSDWIYNLLMWGAVALCAARPLTVAAERGAWAFLAASLAVWAAADLTWTLHFNTSRTRRIRTSPTSSTWRPIRSPTSAW